MFKDMFKRKEKREFSSGFSIENLLKKPVSKGVVKNISHHDGTHYSNVSLQKKTLERNIKNNEIAENKEKNFCKEPKISKGQNLNLPPPPLDSRLVEGEVELSSLKFLFEQRRKETEMELYDEYYQRTTLYPRLNMLQNQTDSMSSAFSVPLWNGHSAFKGSGLFYPCSHRKQELLYTNNSDDSKKCVQVRFSHSQSTELERVFLIQKYISPYERKQISRSLDLSERQIKTWFQNRRAKWRRLKAEDEIKSRVTTKISSY